VTRTGLIVGSCFVVFGVFWAGRESTHGLGAFYEHWWCPIPLAMIVIGVLIAVVPHVSRPGV
jgi:hypothetical protein